ncbi:HNH endonuclease [Flavobacterium caseinilyticum]|uniref:HNH endonuclease n=1 Tax=Flavobacterium caseinilyticum TaxID=2541732 RepID=UPI001A9F4705|nr:HNH endonuclease [Flavobacterium caseinilyticum]
MTYLEKLKSPKWQKKRLEILERDNFSCKCCGDFETSLHVHHTKYLANTDPWEYENDSLITLCETCHAEVTWKKKEVKRIIDEEFIYPDLLSELHLLLLEVSKMNPYTILELTKSITHE